MRRKRGGHHGGCGEYKAGPVHPVHRIPAGAKPFARMASTPVRRAAGGLDQNNPSAIRQLRGLTAAGALEGVLAFQRFYFRQRLVG